MKICERELRDGVSPENSWHHKYRNCAYIYAGNFEFELSEGDLITAFSQFGEIVDFHLIRDEDQKSRGFCYIAFEDQRSTVLAIDNMNGYHLYRRPLQVDHAPNFKPPRRDKESGARDTGIWQATGAEGLGLGVVGQAGTSLKFEEKSVKKEE